MGLKHLAIDPLVLPSQAAELNGYAQNFASMQRLDAKALLALEEKFKAQEVKNGLNDAWHENLVCLRGRRERYIQTKGIFTISQISL